MTWLNWSLKLHIRLWTISILVPTHITHVYAQWMPYSFVWLYLFKCVSHAQFLLIKHKKNFECLNCFWKVFFFTIYIYIIFKNSVALFASQTSRMPLVARLYRSFHDFLASVPSSHKKHLEIFLKKNLSKVFGGLSWWLVRDLV